MWLALHIYVHFLSFLCTSHTSWCLSHLTTTVRSYLQGIDWSNDSCNFIADGWCLDQISPFEAGGKFWRRGQRFSSHFPVMIPRMKCTAYQEVGASLRPDGLGNQTQLATPLNMMMFAISIFNLGSLYELYSCVWFKLYTGLYKKIERYTYCSHILYILYTCTCKLTCRSTLKSTVDLWTSSVSQVLQTCLRPHGEGHLLLCTPSGVMNKAVRRGIAWILVNFCDWFVSFIVMRLSHYHVLV